MTPDLRQSKYTVSSGNFMPERKHSKINEALPKTQKPAYYQCPNLGQYAYQN
jgi:hypothetical protein